MRVVVTINMVGLNAYRRDNFSHPDVALALVAGLVAWTGVAIWLYRDHARRTPSLLVADLAIVLAAMAATPWLKSEHFNATIPGFWVMGALLAWAIHWHWRGGLVAAALISAADLLPRAEVDQGNYGNVFLILIGGPVVGFMCESLQRMARERDAAERAAAAAEERTRLARAVHDGVLQVLAMTQRRGAAAGGEWADLGRLAGEQERSLRSLIRQQDTVPTGAGAQVDLAGALEAMASAHPVRVEVATPGGAVLVDARVAQETVAAVRACLDNVLTHVGPDANAWVLAQAAPDSITVSVRDDGPGIEAGRLEQAAAEGRLGVASSIRGRVEELGGTAVMESGSWGTEWELTVPLA
ncbi:Signal transduction histidine kinase [Nocardioides exalbidus]|uniref:Signal transduction histidine kinase n=1 Tax=Nocardioides exalbidus TaxID=402596 RepID=A0A1H4ZXL9_9ACTN|nr:Signal transduction histidine kinase [Nocardioides exalbidus]